MSRDRISRSWYFCPIFYVIGGCSGKAPEIPPKPTTLVGQVFTQLESGSSIKASGRDIFLTTPTAETKVRIDQACALSDRMSASLTDRISGRRKVGNEELPLQFQIMLQSDMLTTGISDAFSRYGNTVARTVTDIEGRFKFEDIPSGEFVLTTKHDVAERRFGWSEIVTVRAGQENSAILGPDASKWVGLCPKVQLLKIVGP